MILFEKNIDCAHICKRDLQDQFEINCYLFAIFQSKMLDQVYPISHSPLDEILNFVNSTFFQSFVF